MAEKEDTKSKRDPFEFIKQKAAEVAAKAEQARQAKRDRGPSMGR